MTWKGKAGVVALMVATLSILTIQYRKIEDLNAEIERHQNNTETLLSDVERFRVQDSLSAARVQSLELTVQEFNRFRAEDAALIQSLKKRNQDLASINSAQSQTIIALQAIPRDTVVIRDSVKVPAVAVHCGDAWFDFDGILTEREFTGTLANRDSLMIAETVQYKRFLGFLWKTNKVKAREMNAVSKNPHTEIIGMEYIVIEK